MDNFDSIHTVVFRGDVFYFLSPASTNIKIKNIEIRNASSNVFRCGVGWSSLILEDVRIIDPGSYSIHQWYGMAYIKLYNCLFKSSNSFLWAYQNSSATPIEIYNCTFINSGVDKYFLELLPYNTY